VSVDIPTDQKVSAASQGDKSLVGGDFERFLRQAQQLENDAKVPLREWLELAEAWRIAQALRETGGNRSAAARALGIGRRTLYAKMDRLGIGPVWSVFPRSGGD
jgi:DNA-binding NtrC family response regulator